MDSTEVAIKSSELLALGQPQAAAVILTQFLGNDPDHVHANFQLGRCYLLSKNYHDALRYLAIGHKSNPKFALASIIVALKELGLHDLASIICEYAITENGNIAPLISCLASGKIPDVDIPKADYLALAPDKFPRKLKVFSDQIYKPENEAHIEALFPAWGLIEESDERKGAFIEWAKHGKEIFEFTDLANCDAAIYPATYCIEKISYPARLCIEAMELAKPTIILLRSDNSNTILLPNVVSFRTSLYETARMSHEHALPVFVEDPIQLYLAGRMRFKEKSNKAVISFCGQLIKEANSPRNIGIVKLAKSDLITTNFIIRSGFNSSFSEEDPLEYRYLNKFDYVRNSLQGDYVFCARGAGNYSYRLYETMALGRIPILLNTECVLPLRDRIDWKSACLWVDWNDIDRLPQIIADYHNSISPEEFLLKQQRARDIWLKYLTPFGFFSQMGHYLDNVSTIDNYKHLLGYCRF